MPCGTWKTLPRSCMLSPSWPAAVGAHRHARHALDAAGDDEVLRAGHHAHRREVDRLEPGAAEAVEGDAGDLVGPARREHRVARDVGALLADLRDAADDDVVDVRRVDPRLLGETVERLGEQLLRMDVRERALARLAAPRGVRTASRIYASVMVSLSLKSGLIEEAIVGPAPMA